jgi:ankyrin repeat protein
MYKFLKKTIILQLTSLFIALLLFINAYGVISTQQFKHMCVDEKQIKHFNDLNLMLAKATVKDKKQWIFNFDNMYNSPLVYAIDVKNLPIAKLIIEHCIRENINYNNFTMSDGTSMLTLAAKKNDYATVAFLLNYNHPVQMDYIFKLNSPLHEAAKHQNSMVFIILKEKCTDTTLFHRQDNKGLTPINYLIGQQKELLAIELLQAFPVDLNHIPTDFKGMSYLHYAVYNQMHELTKTLLEQGFNPKQASDLGTALDLAIQTNNSNIINLTKYCKKKQYINSEQISNYCCLTAILHCYRKNKADYQPIL